MVFQNSQSTPTLVSKPSDDTEVLQSWVNEAPLKLVASVLCDMPNSSGTAGDIREAVESRVDLKPKWATWWTKQVRPTLAKSKHFSVGKANRITLLDQVDEIPAEPLRPVRKSRKAKTSKKEQIPGEKRPSKLEREWMEWFRGEVEGPPPTRGRMKEALNALDKCDSSVVGRVLLRMTQCADVSSSSKQAAGAWARLISRAASRWRGDAGPYAGNELAEAVGQTMARLVEVAGFPQDAGRWLCQASGLPDGQPETWRNAFAAGVWKTVDNSRDNARNWFRPSFHRLAHEDRVAAALEITLAAFRSPHSSIQHVQLDLLLDFLSMKDEVDFLHALMVHSASGRAPKERVLNYVDHKSQSIDLLDRREGLELLVLATLLLTDGQGPVVDRASRQIGEVLEDSSLAGASAWSALMAEGQQRIASLRKQQTTELESQRLYYEGKLEERRREEGRLIDVVQRLRAEIAAGREVARMDILQDILTVITETLQSLRRSQDSPEQMLRRIEANLTLALRAGGAEEFGMVDDNVPYDPIRHQADQYVTSGSPVRITSPGAIIPGKVSGDRVLLKAGVVVPAEVS